MAQQEDTHKIWESLTLNFPASRTVRNKLLHKSPSLWYSIVTAENVSRHGQRGFFRLNMNVLLEYLKWVMGKINRNLCFHVFSCRTPDSLLTVTGGSTNWAYKFLPSSSMMLAGLKGPGKDEWERRRGERRTCPLLQRKSLEKANENKIAMAHSRQEPWGLTYLFVFLSSLSVTGSLEHLSIVVLRWI